MPKHDAHIGMHILIFSMHIVRHCYSSLLLRDYDGVLYMISISLSLGGVISIRLPNNQLYLPTVPNITFNESATTHGLSYVHSKNMYVKIMFVHKVQDS